MEKGSRWRVGTVSSIFVYQDRWIPRPSSFKAYSPPVLNGGYMVSDLKLPSRRWNEDLILNSFHQDDASAILSILCSLSHRADSLCWHPKKMGIFLVKSAYHLSCSVARDSVASGLRLGSSESWWKYLWRMKLPTKVKLHI